MPVVTHHSFVPYRYFREDFVKRSILSICNLLNSDFPNYLSNLFCCCCSVAMSCPTVCNPTDCSTPGSSVLHCLLELAQIHVHWVGDAIQPSHPLSSPSPPAFNLSQHGVFSNELALHIRWPKDWNFSFSLSLSHEYSAFLFSLGWTGWISLQSKGFSRVFSSTTVQKHQFFGTQASLCL